MFYDIGANELSDIEMKRGEDVMETGKYSFSAVAFVRAAQILCAVNEKPGVDYLVIDEISPLEIKQQKGLYCVLEELLG